LVVGIFKVSEGAMIISLENEEIRNNRIIVIMSITDVS
jgi:hypothetical protein